jgi:pilus assembly protein CpaC
MLTSSLRHKRVLRTLLSCSLVLLQATGPVVADDGNPPIIHKVDASEQRIEMVENTSRILTLDMKIPKAQVNNPDVLDLNPVGAKQVQIHAKKPGITQVNLWDEKGQIHAIDVVVIHDVKELTRLLKSQFPQASITVVPTATGVILTGFADQPQSVERIVTLAQDFFPRVMNNITVGGAQQVMLHVKVMEVSRTKLRDLGFDFADIMEDGSFITQGVSGLLRNATATGVTTSADATLTFGIVDANNSFFGVLSALQRNNVAKLLAEPTLVTVSGRPAYFQSGGEIPVLIPQGLGNVSVEFRPFGTQVDFVPIVLGDGRVRLEVRPRVSEIDRSLSVTLNGSVIPGFRTRQVDTGVEMRIGQTLALAGLIQTRIEANKRGLPWLSDLPYLGVPFRRVDDTVNEIELLVMVRPELAEALDPHEVPPCGPGESTISPLDCDLYLKGHIEAPNPNCVGCEQGNCASGNCVQGGTVDKPVTPSMQPDGSIPSGYEVVPAPHPATSSRSVRPSQGRVAAAQPQSARRASASSRRVPSQQIAPRYNPPVTKSRAPVSAANAESGEPGLIGPTGYDVIN